MFGAPYTIQIQGLTQVRVNGDIEGGIFDIIKSHPTDDDLSNACTDALQAILDTKDAANLSLEADIATRDVTISDLTATVSAREATIADLQNQIAILQG